MQDVAQKYELYGRERGVRIETELQRDASFVNADIAMIDRVFESLIENRREVYVTTSRPEEPIPPRRAGTQAACAVRTRNKGYTR